MISCKEEQKPKIVIEIKAQLTMIRLHKEEVDSFRERTWLKRLENITTT